MYLIPYDSAMCLLSYTCLYIDLLCIFLCGKPILGNFENYFTKTAPNFTNLFNQ